MQKSNKILRNYDNIVVYTKEHWEILKKKRERSIKLMEIFEKEGFNPYVYGSIARGDVGYNSDIDIIFLDAVPFYMVELILSKNNINVFNKEIIMATPKDSLKLYIYLSELECITVPLTKLSKKGMEFYNFGGKIDLRQLKDDVRVPGVDKRLVLIEPNENGHEEHSIIGNEHVIAKKINVSIDTILEREKVLLKREKHGRTGVFLKRVIGMHETTENVLRELARKKSIVRRKLN
ncbi:MAG: nucleotidyltransferase domain-containing protein [Promethearchaeota archaeon]